MMGSRGWWKRTRIITGVPCVATAAASRFPACRVHAWTSPRLASSASPEKTGPSMRVFATLRFGGPRRSLARDVTPVGAATLTSRLLGFLRDAGIAAILGAGVLSDAYFAALQIPNLFRRLLEEGQLNIAFLPLR